ncbi:MAG: heavy metal translocating P-type ATPase, partial [Cyanobacteria bacterium J06600_6]
MLLGFILLGRTLEGKARNRASAALEKLVTLQPPIARLIGKDNQSNSAETIEIPVEQVKPGEWLRVLPGEKMPVDGVVVGGETTIDEAMLTGESAAVLKTESDLVRAGTINQSGVITVEVTGIGRDTALAKIINLVEDAQTKKAPVQQLADTIAGYFAYGVMAISTVTFLFWYFIGTNIWDGVLTTSTSMDMGMSMSDVVTTSPLLLSLKLAIAVLVVACPCALGLATPTAILVGTSIGAESGILIKGGDVLERVQQLDTVVFDKTGTLTIGKPQVTECIALTDLNSEKLLQTAASIESGSAHPLAQAITVAARAKGLTLLETSNFKTVIGRGISATVAGETTFLGNRQWLESNKIKVKAQIENQANNLAKLGKTVSYLAQSGTIVGLIAMEDSLRDDALSTVKQLHSLGFKTVLLTGDRPEVAQAIAQKLNITQIFSEVQPEGKAQIIQSLQENGVVGMIGDGINDAPALAQADVGISLQGGTDVAIATANIVLMQNRLQDAIKSIKLSRATVDKIKQNLGWALAYNLLAIPLAAGILLPKYGIFLSPVLAAAAMASSSLIV